MQEVKYINLGLIDYKEAWDYQEDLFQAIIDVKKANRQREKDELPLEKTQSKLIFCEHPHVFTLGKSGEQSNLLVNEKQLAAKGARFYKINRVSCMLFKSSTDSKNIRVKNYVFRRNHGFID